MTQSNPTQLGWSGLLELTPIDEDGQLGNLEGIENDRPASRPQTDNSADKSNSLIQSESTFRKWKANTEEALICSLIKSVNNIGVLCKSTSQGIQDVASYFKSLSATNECQERDS